jgi:enamine deaminase RidA (YjgF/YER057c/UK114 family)
MNWLTKTVQLAVVCAVAVLGVEWRLGNNSIAAQTPPAFTKEFVDKQDGFTRVIVVRSGGIRTIYLSGNVGTGDDLKTQMTGAYQSIVNRLASVGAKPSDIVKTTAYVVNLKPQDYRLWRNTVTEVLKGTELPTAVLAGVQALAAPSVLFEVDAIAVTKD